MGHAHDVIDELRGPTRSLRQASPDVWAGFGQLHQAAVADGVLPAKVKELMALVVAVVKQCDGCIAVHVDAALKQGATREEIAEALGVAIAVNAGAALVYSSRVMDALPDVGAA